MDSKLQEARDFYENRIIGWMINDLRKSIDAETNFLTALGCLVYTEIIGFFLPPLPEENGASKERRFYRCLFRFASNNYLRFLDKFFREETNKGIYQHLRHSMTHRYYPRVDKKGSDGVIVSIPSVIARDGVAVDMEGERQGKSPSIFLSKDGKIVIATKNYTDELFQAVKDFRKYTFEDNEPDYLEYAKKGIDSLLRGT